MLWALQAMLPGQFSGGWAQAPNLLIISGLFLFLGKIATEKMRPVWGEDPSKVVIDEIVGVWIAMIGVPFSWLNLALAFGLFRLFDIQKPLGIRRMERLPGGWGVMMDDVLAGVYANVVLQATLYFWQKN